MRCITYAGETILTTDDVADALVTLTAAVAKYGDAEAVRIPIVVESSGDLGEAELVIGVGNDVLSAPTRWDQEEPDFSAAVTTLKSHRLYPQPPARGGLHSVQDLTAAEHYDLDFDGLDRG